MHRPSTISETLIFPASLALVPTAWVFAVLSLPAKSTMEILLTLAHVGLDSLLVCINLIVNTQWLQKQHRIYMLRTTRNSLVSHTFYWKSSSTLLQPSSCYTGRTCTTIRLLQLTQLLSPSGLHTHNKINTVALYHVGAQWANLLHSSSCYDHKPASKLYASISSSYPSL